MVEHLTEKNFKAVIKDLDLAVVDFWAEWCSPCKALSPMLDEFESKLGNKLKFFKVNVDNSPSVASEYGVESIPTLLVFKNGEPINSLGGLTSKKELERRLLSALQ